MVHVFLKAATRLLVGFVAVAGVSVTVLAQDIVKDAKGALADLPAWKIPEICAKDSAQYHCLVLESKAWRAVSGSWVSLPDAVKKTCLGNAKGLSDQSWRVLGDCIDEEMDKQGDKRAVATSRTPAEAVPPPKPVALPTPAKVDVPPPVLGFTVAPPPFAAEAEAKRLADEVAAKKAADEAEAQRRAEADTASKRTAEANEAARQAAEVKRVADNAAARKTAEDIDKKRMADAEADAKRIADAAAAQKAAENAEKKRIADAQAAGIADVTAIAKACEDKLKVVSSAGAIRFRIASATLDRASNATLDQLADVVKTCPGNVIRVEGHTDNQGDPDQNLTLSRNRAQAVVDYLVRAGVAAAQVSAEGLGETAPIADNATNEGRALNRRIAFKVQPK